MAHPSSATSQESVHVHFVGQALLDDVIDVFDVGGWSEIEEFSSMLGLDFDFNQVFDAGFFDLGTADYAVSESPMNVNITENSFHGFLPG